MPDDLGPHLLGRLPTTPDERDFRAENFLEIGKPHERLAASDPVGLIDSGLEHLKKTTYSYPKWAATHYADVTKTHWWQALNCLELAKAALAPPPPLPSSDVVWNDPDSTLDQGDTGHCGGFGGAQWGNTDPIEDHYGNDDAHALYYEAVKIGGFPGSEDGVQSRWVAKALQARGRLVTYAFADQVDVVAQWIRTKGPVMIGTEWTDDMFYPDADGFITPTGPVAGGHFTVLIGDLTSEGAFLGLNSWGASWGENGRYKLRYDDFGILLGGIEWGVGDAIVTTELPL